MKSKTIWESASRPLFVRSVWLESLHEGRGVQYRHFILDYESQKYVQQQRQHLKSSFIPVRSWGRSESLRNLVSCELPELNSFEASQITAEKLPQIGSAKIKLQQPINQQTRQRFKLLKLYRRPSLTKQARKQSTTDYEVSSNWKLREVYSRHSSLLDLQLTPSNANQNPEERLAERVLNWLDLAGKSGLVKGQEDEVPLEMFEMENVSQNFETHKKKTQEQSQQLLNYQRQKTQPRQPFQGSVLHKKRVQNHLNHYSSDHLSEPRTNRHKDGVKPITIIFHRDGFPVRLNRAARNIDLCTLASSAGTTRRLAGSLASTRLYHGNETISYRSRTVKPIENATCRQAHRSSSTARSRHGTDAEKPTTQASQKRLYDGFGGNHTQDSKRQLHIFMPSLPKKGLNSASPSLLSTANIDDGSLSQQFQENCTL